MAKTAKDIVNGLLGRIDTTANRYEVTLEKKQGELIDLTQKLQDAEVKAKELHKMNILGDVSDATYKKAADEVETAKANLAELNKQISLIDHYKREDIQEVLAEIDGVKQEFNLERQKEVYRIQAEVQKAKLEYLQAMLKAREDYKKVSTTDFKLADVLVKMGLRKGHYISGTFDALGFPTSDNNGTSFAVETPFIDKPLAFDVLEYGKLPSSLLRFVEVAKKDGYIK